MGLYHDLVMPWELSQPCTEFENESYRRSIWNEKGRASEDGSFLCGDRWTSLEDYEAAIGTISAATRWREAHPEIANTEEDVVKKAFAMIRGMLEAEGLKELCMVGPSVVVSLKRG